MLLIKHYQDPYKCHCSAFLLPGGHLRELAADQGRLVPSHMKIESDGQQDALFGHHSLDFLNVVLKARCIVGNFLESHSCRCLALVATTQPLFAHFGVLEHLHGLFGQDGHFSLRGLPSAQRFKRSLDLVLLACRGGQYLIDEIFFDSVDVLDEGLGLGVEFADGAVDLASPALFPGGVRAHRGNYKHTSITIFLVSLDGPLALPIDTVSRMLG